MSIVMTSQINGLNQSVRNANDGISLPQTADGALGEVVDILQRMRELAVQAGNSVLSDNQQDYLAVEFDALADSLETIADNTSFNGVSILQNNGLVPPPAGLLKNTYEIKGADANTVMVAVNVLSLDSLATATQTLNIGTTLGSPVNAIALLDLQLDLLADSRAELGAAMNTLAYVADAQMAELANTEVSRSRIADTDYAIATTELARAQIIQQAGTSMLAQANQAPQSVLALLQ